MAKKTGLVLQGGGMRGAFTAGVLDVFMEHHLSFSYVIGTSAGGLNGVNFISGDIGRGKYVTCEMVHDKKFLSVKNLLLKGSLFDFKYLLFTLPEKNILPFNNKTYEENPSEFLVACTGMEDGEAHYFKKGECRDFWNAIAASASLPLLAKPVEVEDKLYLDGGPTASIPFKKALEDGCEKVVVIGTREPGYRKKPLKESYKRLCKRFYHAYPRFIESYDRSVEVYNGDANEMENLQKEGKLFLVQPEFPVTVSQTEKDEKALLALYLEGRRIAEENLDSLRDYLKD